MQKNTGIISLAILTVLLLSGAGCQQRPANDNASETAKQENKSPIKIGWMGPLTGDVATVGVACKKAAELAIKEINETGGISGRQIELKIEDAACDSKTAMNAGNKLVNVEKVGAIIGGYCSGETLAVAPTAESNKTVMISPASTAPSITTAGDYIFRVVPSDSYQGKYAAQFVYNDLGLKKAAVLYAKTDYTEGLANVFSQEFKNLGGEVIVTDSFLQTARDLRTQLTKIKNSGADVLYFPTYTEAAVAGLKQARALGLNIQIMGADPFDDPKLYSIQGSEGVIYTKPASLTNENFKTKFLAYTNDKELPVYVPQTYDAVNLLAQAIKKVGDNPEAIKNEMYSITNYHGVSGDIGFDQNGDLLTAQYEIMKIKNNVPEKYTK